MKHVRKEGWLTSHKKSENQKKKWENILNIERKLLLTKKYLCSKDIFQDYKQNEGILR